MEELAAMRLLKGTMMGSDLFAEVNASMDKLGLNGTNWARAVNHRRFVSLLEEHASEHSDLGYQTTVRWFSLGKVLKRLRDFRALIQEFCEKKGKGIPELTDTHWRVDLAFAVDVTTLMNERSTKLPGKGLFAHEISSLVMVFMRKLSFLSSQLEGDILTHMPTLKDVTPPADHLHRHSSMLRALHDEAWIMHPVMSSLNSV
ncbi:hypothetical protein SRHO_G00082530 [Serrasalmus rhombeus]